MWSASTAVKGIFAVAFLAVFGCSSGGGAKPTVATSGTPLVVRYGNQSFQDVEVQLVGRYQEMNVNKRTQGDPIYNGRVQIMTQDSIYVMLETHETGLRQASEIEQYRGKIVAVHGTLNDNCLAWGNGEIASIVGPCIRDIKSIELRPE